MLEISSNARRWYVIHTNPRQEERANNNLTAWQVTTFSPKIRERRLNPFTGAPTYITKALFPRYIFARFDAHDFLHKVRFTRGVHSVVSFGESPTPVDDEIIRLIQSRADENGFIKINDDFKPGDKVVIKDGPLQSLIGVFERETSEAHRVMILLETVSYQARLVVERAMVQKLN
ncbi:MAG TPA: transcription termination/antitermination NusG family protein [Pyrinomonadaceae bacterium]|jgi:transcriptional antiterminator RfaH